MHALAEKIPALTTLVSKTLDGRRAWHPFELIFWAAVVATLFVAPDRAQGLWLEFRSQ